MSSAISPIAIVRASGMASPGPVLVLGMYFWYLLVTVVPFLVGVLATPNTCPTAGFRRGTATQIPRDPGQPPPVALTDPPGLEQTSPGAW
jgi:hypothetical protein